MHVNIPGHNRMWISLQLNPISINTWNIHLQSYEWLAIKWHLLYHTHMKLMISGWMTLHTMNKLLYTSTARYFRCLYFYLTQHSIQIHSIYMWTKLNLALTCLTKINNKNINKTVWIHTGLSYPHLCHTVYNSSITFTQHSHKRNKNRRLNSINFKINADSLFSIMHK